MSVDDRAVGEVAELDGAHGAPRSGEFVQSLERGLSVIRAFGTDRSHLTLTEVARAAGLTRAAARRFLLTLVELGYVHSDGRTFSLRPRVLELGYAYLAGLSLPEVARPHMEGLVGAIRETSSISVLDGDEIVYVARCPTRRIMTVAISVGTRLPAYCTSMGRILLAALPAESLGRYLDAVERPARTRRTVTDRSRLGEILAEVAASGHAVVDQELEDGLVSVAVPIHDLGGSIVAALNVSANALRIDAPRLEEEVLPALRHTAGQIEEGLKAGGAAAGERA